MKVDLRGTGGGFRMAYADAVTFRSWALQGDERAGFILSAVPAKVVDAYCSSELTVWIPLAQSAWEWDGITLGQVDPATSLTVTLRGMPRIVRH